MKEKVKKEKTQSTIKERRTVSKTLEAARRLKGSIVVNDPQLFL